MGGSETVRAGRDERSEHDLLDQVVHALAVLGLIDGLQVHAGTMLA